MGQLYLSVSGLEGYSILENRQVVKIFTGALNALHPDPLGQIPALG